MTQPMNTFEAVCIAEGNFLLTQYADATEKEMMELHQQAWQVLHNTGLAYQLQGWFGRQAQHYLDTGYIER